MTTKARRKGPQSTKTETAPPEPSWRQRPPSKPRAKMKAQSAVPAVGSLPRRRLLPGPIHLPVVRFRLALRHWLVLLLVTAAAFGAVQLFSNDRFFVYAADISGNQRVPQEEIYAATDLEGMNIFWVRPQDVEERVRRVPGIAEATAHVRLPNQVMISVHERLPLVRWEVNDQVTWVAEDGQPVPVAGAEPPLRLIDSEGAAAGPGRNRPGLPRALMTNLQAVHAARPELVQIYYGAQEGLYFRAPQGYTVYLGTQGDFVAKLNRLQSAQQQIARDGTNPKVVDLRLPGTVYYR